MDIPTFSASEVQGAQVEGAPGVATSSTTFPSVSVGQLKSAKFSAAPVTEKPSFGFYQTPSEAEQAGDVAWQAFLHIPETVASGVGKELPTTLSDAFAKSSLGKPFLETSGDLAEGLSRLKYQNQHTVAGSPYTKEQLNAAEEIGISLPGSGERTASAEEVWGLPKEPPTTGDIYTGPLSKANVNLGKYHANQTPLTNFLVSNTLASAVKNTLNAPLLNRLRVDTLNSFVKAKQIIANPNDYTPTQLKWATATYTSLKNSGGVAEGVQQLFKSAVKDPEAFGVSTAEQLVQHPEMLFIGAAGPESLAGKVISGSVEGAAANLPYTALQSYGQQGYVSKGELESSVGQGAAFGAGAALLHALPGKGKPDFTKSGGSPEAPLPETPTEKTPKSAPGGAKLREMPQTEKPHFRVGPDGELIPVEASTPESGSVTKAARKAAEKYTKSANPKADQAAEPPTHVWRVNDSQDVGLTGGVSEDGKTVHLSKEIPEELKVKNKDGGESTVNPKPYITTHELVEASIMRHKGPWDSDEIAALRKKMGGALIPKKIYTALTKDGKVSYQQAHYLATLAENHHFDLVHPEVDHNEYQKALGDTIKKSRESAVANPGNTPSDLDEKPYRDAGEEKLVAEGKGSGVKRVLPAVAGASLGAYAYLHNNQNPDLKHGVESIFGGILAAEAPRAEFEHAAALREAGVPSDVIWERTGISYGKDGKPRFEISDHTSKVSSFGKALTPEHGEVPFTSVLEHSGLEKHYGKALRDWKVKVDPNLSRYGETDSSTKTIKIRLPSSYDEVGEHSLHSVLLHEAQHIVQREEGFAPGSTIETHRNLLKGSAALEGKPPEYLEGAARLDYIRNTGEVEARNVQARAALTPEERHTLPPESTIPPKVRELEKVFPELYKALQNPASESVVPDESRLPNEEEVIDQAKQGDQGAVEKLFRNYYPRLKNKLAHTAAGEHAIRVAGVSADDLAQQTFLQAFKNLHSFQGNSEFFTWLYRIGQNEAKQALRSASGRVRETSMDEEVATGSPDVEKDPTQLLQADIADKETTPESDLEAQQTAHVLRGALSKLSRGQRQVFDLSYLQGLSNQEIAEQLGMPQPTVASLLMRARDAIEQHLKENDIKFSVPRTGAGRVDPELLKKMAKISAIVAGASFGAAYSNDKLKGALVGGLGAFAATLIPLNDAIKSVKELTKEPKVDFQTAKNELFDRDSQLRIADRHAQAFSDHLRKLAPEPERQQAITDWMEGDKTIPLTDKEYEAATLAKAAFDKLGALAQQHEVVKKLLDEYVTHIFSKEDQAKISAYREANPQKFDAATTSPYGKERKIPFTLKQLREAKDINVTPKYTGIADIMYHYQKSITTAVINKSFLDSLRSRGLVFKSDFPRPGFTYLNLPALRGFQVHSDIAPELNMAMSNYEPGAIGAAVSAVNTAGKLSILFGSFFHALNISWQVLTSTNNPIEALGVIAKSAVGKTKYHEMIKNSSFGDTVDEALKANLRFQYKPSKAGGVQNIDPDYAGNVQRASQWLQREMDRTIPYSGKLVTAVTAASNKMTDFLFGNLATGGSLSMWDKYRAGMKLAKAKELGRSLTDKENIDIDREAAEAVNNTMRAVNWQRAALESSNRTLRRIKLGLFSKRGMQALENTFLAPTWKYGLIRTITKSFGEGTGLKGLLTPQTTADLQRAFILRSAIIYATVGNAINYATVGRPIWENEDPFMIDLPNGSHIQWAKSLMELGESFYKPGEATPVTMAQTTLNSLSPLAGGGAEAFFNKKYLSAQGHAGNITESQGWKGVAQRALYPIEKAQPIPLQQAEEYGWKGALRGVAGFSEYGATKAQRAIKRAQAVRKAAETRKRNEMLRGY